MVVTNFVFVFVLPFYALTKVISLNSQCNILHFLVKCMVVQLGP